VQSDGKIVVRGATSNPPFYGAVVARYLTDGTPDPTFGTNGIALVPEEAGVSPTTRLLLDSQGRIVTHNSRYLIRMLSNGALDPGFGTMGVRELGPDLYAHSIAFAPGEEIIAVGFGVWDTAVMERYTAAGFRDEAFGDDGQVRFGGKHFPGPTGLGPTPFRVLVVPDGRIYVTGQSLNRYLLGRFLPDGTADETFGPEGLLLTSPGDETFGESLDLALQADGAILQVGYASDGIIFGVPAFVRYVACGPPASQPPSILSVQPAIASARGGEVVTITGSNLDAAPGIHVGYVPGVVVGSPAPGTIQVEVPSGPMGYADVALINSDCQWTSRPGALFLHPSDVLPTSPYFPFVRRVLVNEVTWGCSAFEYCPDIPAYRSSMAVSLLRAKEGPDYQPPPATGKVFADVPIDSYGADSIEELWRRGITGGCAANLYCPNDVVTRAQMAVFLLVTLEGTGYQPPAATGDFADVPVSSPYARWIEEIHARRITSGCGANLYCPDDPVRREQMAVFLSVTFNLPG
jgi:uncharacterized delta-60 repeat protein